MADLKIEKHPARSDFVYIFNDATKDQYGDSFIEEVGRVLKSGILQLKPDLQYLQDIEEELIEDDKEPYVVVLTITDMLRKPMASDYVLIEGVLYKVSYVKPTNRYTQVIFDCLIYPERDEEDPLKIFDVSFYQNGKPVHFPDVEECRNIPTKILYGGHPVEMSFDEGKTWKEFEAVTKSDIGNCFNLWIKDESGKIAKFTYHVN